MKGKTDDVMRRAIGRAIRAGVRLHVYSVRSHFHTTDEAVKAAMQDLGYQDVWARSPWTEEQVEAMEAAIPGLVSKVTATSKVTAAAVAGFEDCVRRLVEAGVRPNVTALRRHFGLSAQAARVAAERCGYAAKSAGIFSRTEAALHQEIVPEVDVSKTIKYSPQALPEERVLGPAPLTPEELAQRPPQDELEDAAARWGYAGCAEEYDVPEETICAWLRSYPNPLAKPPARKIKKPLPAWSKP